MRFLFIHNNFPGQFVHIVRELARAGHEVVFLSQYAREDAVAEGVRRIPVPRPVLNAGEIRSRSHKVAREIFLTGEAYGRAMSELAASGFYPDVVCAHPGWGGSLYVPDVFPDAGYVVYGEWFYTRGELHRFFAGKRKDRPAAFAANRHRNLCQLDALRECDAVVCPTAWQMSQYPVEYAPRIRVLHDGIDTEFFSPAPPAERGRKVVVQGLELSALPEIVTYATRGMEPYRGFPQFFRSIPRILEARPDCHVVIMGNDSTHYSDPRADGRSWGDVMRSEVPVDAERVHFLRFGPYEEYRAVLRAASVHVYLTAPFVLSWSMLEAMSCGCAVVASATSPVREVVSHGANGLLTSFWNSDEIAGTVVHALGNPRQLEELRKEARKTVLARYSLAKLLPAHLEILAGVAARKGLRGMMPDADPSPGQVGQAARP